MCASGSSDEKAAAKAAKKQAKAALKAEKARQQAAVLHTSAAGTEPAHDAMSPAERSARAAERKVRLTYFRVWIGAAALLVSLIAAVLAWVQWSRGRSESPARPAEVAPAPQE